MSGGTGGDGAGTGGGTGAGTAGGDAAIAIFAKAPRPGFVKTRLTPRLTPEEAARVARAALDDTIRHIVPAVSARWTLYLDGAPDDSIRSLAAEHGVGIRDQRGADLGERLVAAFKEMRRDGERDGGRSGERGGRPGDGPGGRDGPAGDRRGRPVLAIGSDSPTLDPRWISEAIDALSAVDVVLGPAEDGGYYLVGMSGGHEAIFEEIPWGSSTVAERTIARTSALGLTLRLLPPWYDLDEAASLLRADRDLPEGGRGWEIRALLEGLRSKLESGA